ncbi:MAG: FkbM family methyltransferase [Candidatus Bathyarchaeota archaeon]|nr:FkbM family methyltransferase [Candidatus Bathyarchaeota archaeon]
MPTLSGLYRTIQTTRSFWAVMQLRNSSTPQTIKFRNGVEAKTTYLQYTLLRDWFWKLQKQGYRIEKTEGGCIVKKGEFIYQTNYPASGWLLFDLLLDLKCRGWSINRTKTQYSLQKDGAAYTITQTGDNLFEIQSKKIHLVGPIDLATVYFIECSEEKLYETNFQGKVVLDVGGFCGETAALFSSLGAAKVIIYEPISEYQTFIEQNIRLNHVNAELYNEGIGETDGSQTINYDQIGVGFGLLSKGQKSAVIKIKKISSILKETKPNIAKIDCEGAETCLINVAPEVLGLVHYYFIETHTRELQVLVEKKFLESGFKKAREPTQLNDGTAMLYFTRNS